MIAPAQYIQQRIDDQIAWYSHKSRRAQMRYKTLRVASIVISLSIPILTGMIGGGHDAVFKLIISVEAALVALIEGVLSLYKYKDIWTGYRATGESLKYHRFLFEAGAAPYDVANAFQVFVQNAEGLMAEERVAWVQTNKAIPEDKPVAAPIGGAAAAQQPELPLQPQPESPATPDASQQPAPGPPATQQPDTLAAAQAADDAEEEDANGPS